MSASIMVPVHFNAEAKTVMVEFHDGGRIQLGGGGPHEEGWSRWSEEIWMADGTVWCEFSEEGVDCDGRSSSHTLLAWSPTLDLWETVKRGQRDHTAESMGY